jgi:signal transduction histidine kinase
MWGLMRPDSLFQKWLAKRLPATLPILLTAGPAVAQDTSAVDPQLVLYGAGALGALVLVLGVLLARANGAAARSRATLATRLNTAESDLHKASDDANKLRAEQLLLRDKIDTLGRERDGYRKLCNAAPFAAWRRDSGGAIIWRNNALAEIIGPEANSDEIASRADQDRPIQLIERAQAEGQIAIEERRFVVDGQRRTFQVYETPPLDDTGTAGFAMDVSAVERIRSELRKQIEASYGMFEHINTAVAIYDRERKLMFCNSAFRKLWGLDEAFTNAEPTIGEVLDRLTETRRLPEEVDFRQFRKGREALFNALLDPIEELYQRPDERMVRVTVTRHGLGGLMFLFEDATDRIVMERNLNTYIAVQRATLDNLYEAVAVFGPDGRLSLSNAPYRKMWSLNKKTTESQPHVRELVDGVIAGLGHDTDFASGREQLIASATETRSMSGRMDLPDGRVIDVASLTLPDAQKLFTYLDVTDSMQIERALRERNEALVAGDMMKSEFLENMSYELRTPLNTILGFAEILQNNYFGELNDRQREYASGILEASEQFLSMINDMLDLASIQAGHLQVGREKVDIHELLDEAIDNYKDRGSRRQISLKSEVSGDLPGLFGDSKRIGQIVGNLLSNAVKFTPPDGSISIGASRGSMGVDLWVRDTGIGIAEEEQDRVFESFRTSERHTRRGTGLGLALVRNLMELHGGTVELDSEIGRGTLITCHFPAEMPADGDGQVIRIDALAADPAEP